MISAIRQIGHSIVACTQIAEIYRCIILACTAMFLAWSVGTWKISSACTGHIFQRGALSKYLIRRDVPPVNVLQHWWLRRAISWLSTRFLKSNSIFRLSENTVFNIAQNPRGPLLQIDVQTSFQSEFFHLVKIPYSSQVFCYMYICNFSLRPEKSSCL